MYAGTRQMETTVFVLWCILITFYLPVTCNKKKSEPPFYSLYERRGEKQKVHVLRLWKCGAGF